MASVKQKTPKENLKRDNFKIAKERGLAEMALGAKAVRYDRRRDAVVLVMRTGAEATIPRNLIPIVNQIRPSRITRLELSPMGTSLSFPDFDADFAIQALIRRAFNVNEANRIAGATRSPARAAASRANGRKGGRPRRKIAVHEARR